MAAKVYYLLFMITWMWLVLLLQDPHLVDSSKLEEEQEREKEKNALLTLLSRTKQKPEVEQSWTNEPNICKWLGVTCDYDNRVKSLNLPGKSFIGSIPDNSIGALSKLLKLSLPFNAFSGPLPSDLSNLHLLRSLNLHNNTFSGHFPLVLTNLTSLQTLDISANGFSGNIPCEIQDMPLLKRLRLENNRFTGNLPGLHFRRPVNFSVANNNITGAVPTTLSKFPLEAFAGNPLLCGEPLSSLCIYNTRKSYLSFRSYCPAQPSLPNPPLANLAMPGGGALFLLLFLIILLFPVRRKQRPTTNSSDQVQGKSKSNSSSQQRRKLIIFPENDPNSTNTTDTSWANGIDAKEIMSGRSEPMKPGALAKGIIEKSYKVELLMSDKVLVVKHLMDPEAVVSDELDFSNKMEFLGNIRWHENVMPLRGYCIYEEEYLMIYDFIPGGSLYDCLHGSDPLELDWERRKRIALGAARGLAHLHTEVKLAHGNIKSSNILLRGKNHLEAYVADFGLTATPPTSYYGQETTITVPTNIKADVYAFGVLLLELLTGKSPDDTNLVQEMQGGSDNEIWDSKMKSYDEKKKMGMVCLLQIAKQCTHQAADERPEMDKVARMIENMSREDEIGYGSAGPVEELSHEIFEDSLLHPGTPPPPAFTP